MNVSTCNSRNSWNGRDIHIAASPDLPQEPHLQSELSAISAAFRATAAPAPTYARWQDYARAVGQSRSKTPIRNTQAVACQVTSTVT